MSRARRPSWLEVRAAVLDCGVLAIACLVTYWLVTYLLSRLYFVPMADELLGGLWAVIATVFVCRFSYYQSTAAAVSRMAATLVSFALCLIYLIFLPFHPLALAALIGASALGATLMGRPGDAITAGSPPRSSWSRPPRAHTTPGSNLSSALPTPSSASPSASRPPGCTCG